MTDHNAKNNAVTLRNLRDESDHPLLLDINLSSRRADKNDEPITIEAIAHALAADIRGSRLSPGDRLPTHRELAYRLGCTVGTVTRAYSEAERRGLIGGEVGRGTFVRSTPAPTVPYPISPIPLIYKAFRPQRPHRPH